MMKRKKHKTLYINGIKFIALGYIVKKEGKVLIIKTDVRGQLGKIGYKSIETVVIDDVTSFKVKYKTMSILNNEEWEFEILN